MNNVIHSAPKKAELVVRVMSYLTHGVLPLCSACRERVLKWKVRYSSARSYCPGYYIGNQKHPCSGPAESVQTTEWNWGAWKPHAEFVSRARHQQTADEHPEAAVAAAGTILADAAGGREVSDASKSEVPPTRLADGRSPKQRKLAQGLSSRRGAAAVAASAALDATGGLVGNASTASAGRQKKETIAGEKTKSAAECGDRLPIVDEEDAEVADASGRDAAHANDISHEKSEGQGRAMPATGKRKMLRVGERHSELGE